MTRKNLSYIEKIAACLIRIRDDAGEWLIPEPLRSEGSAHEVYRAVQFDHGVLVAHDGTNKPQNVWPMLTPEHREKSKEDTKRAAKTRRILKKRREAEERREREAEENRAKLLAAPLTKCQDKAAPRKRARMGGGRTSDVKLKVDGTVVDRKTGKPVKQRRS